MRPFVYRLASSEGIRGRVRNDPRGVTIEAFADEETLERFLRRLTAERPPAARFDDVAWEPIDPESIESFTIVRSDAAGEESPRISIPPDMATCDDCLAELSDPVDRRYRYPFTNCTNCGPRFTIARGVPYDRALTTMAPFPLCESCLREYEDPSDRRFHAEPNACPVCGPHLTLLDRDGGSLAERDEALVQAGLALAAGRIVAIKGIGGFHLACDAGSGAAVRELRRRKRREEKPLAVMVRDLAEAERLASLDDLERRLLTSPERPIVLAHRREEAGVAPEVAPDTPILGLLLPYSPLHHLLLAEARRPLVMTSGNLSEEPIAYRNGDAMERLASIADLFLVHDREIETRADDSVVRLVGDRPVLLRRSRGHAPRGIRVRRPFAAPTLGCGAHLKNTFCLGLADTAYMGPHIGDLENLETLESFEEAVSRLERFLRIQPEVLACDLHPEYASTRYAQERGRALGVPVIEVQHHHAHVASAMAEHHLAGPVLALAWDGTGLGDDGTAWGGELLLATEDRFERLATFRPLPLAGGDQAIRQPWRLALAALDDAFAGAPPLDALPVFAGVPASELATVRRMIERGFNTPRAHGAGRAFDAVGALVLARSHSRFEGQVAMALDAAADRTERGHYEFEIDATSSPWQLDLRSTYRGVTSDLLCGRPAAVVSARFHATLVAAAAALVRRAASSHGRLPVLLTGGCFANARLAEGILAELSPAFSVQSNGLVPPGDGGVALGQAIVADATLRRGSC